MPNRSVPLRLQMYETNRETFPLTGMDSHIIEKIITKMDAKSYAQMIQTCCKMKDFILKNINIRGIHVKARIYLACPFDASDWKISIRCDDGWINSRIADLVGFRVNRLEFYWIDHPDIESVLKDFEMYRVQIDCLVMSDGFGEHPNIDQCRKLLAIFKPREVEYSGDVIKYSTVLDTILEYRHFVKSIKVETKNEQDVINLATLLLPAFSEIRIYYDTENVAAESPLELLSAGINGKIIDLLFTMPLPNLKSFVMIVARYYPEEDDGGDGNHGYQWQLALPSHFSQDASLKMVTGGRGDNSFYKIVFCRD